MKSLAWTWFGFQTWPGCHDATWQTLQIVTFAMNTTSTVSLSNQFIHVRFNTVNYVKTVWSYFLVQLLLYLHYKEKFLTMLQQTPCKTLVIFSIIYLKASTTRMFMFVSPLLYLYDLNFDDRYLGSTNKLNVVHPQKYLQITMLHTCNESDTMCSIVITSLKSRSQNDVNPKEAGSFDPISQPGGGGGFHPPFRSRPRSGEKLYNLAHM